MAEIRTICIKKKTKPKEHSDWSRRDKTRPKNQAPIHKKKEKQ